MAIDVYERLAQHLDDLPAGFPRTESGVEIRILRRLFTPDDAELALDPNRCIGCGLCVSTCPTDSLSLVRKPKAKQPYVPKDIKGTYIKLGKARGKLGIGKMVRMQVRSKLDRLLAPR